MKLLPAFFPNRFTVLITFFLLISIAAEAQRMDNNTIHLGTGITHHNGPGVFAPSFYLEYSKPFFPRSVIGVATEIALPVDVSTDDETRELLSYRFGMNLYFEALDERKQQLKVGAGFIAGFFSTDWEVIDTGQTGEDNDFQPGFAGLLEYNFIFNEVFILGLSGKVFGFDNEKGAFFAGLHAGYRF